MDFLTDEEIWEKLKKGDQGALDHIYKVNIKALYSYGCKVTYDKNIVEDCIHDIFLELWAKHHLLSNVQKIKPYLFIALNRKIIRRLSRENKYSGFNDENIFGIELSRETLVVEGQHTTEELDKLQYALKNLTPRQREAVFLKYYQHFSFQEVAKVMDIEVKAVYKLTGRAIESLKTFFLVSISLIISNLYIFLFFC